MFSLAVDHNWQEWHGGAAVLVKWGGAVVEDKSAVFVDLVLDSNTVNATGDFTTVLRTELVEVGGAGVSVACGDLLTATVSNVLGAYGGASWVRKGGGGILCPPRW